MNFRWQELLPFGGIAGCCAAAIQVRQLLDGDASPEVGNYAITAATAIAGIGLTGLGYWQRRPNSVKPHDDRQLLAATDLLFAHFAEDAAAQEAVRVVARAVVERRYGNANC